MSTNAIPKIGCVQHDCGECRVVRLRLAAALAELHDIVDNSPRNSIAWKRAKAAVDSLDRQSGEHLPE